MTSTLKKLPKRFLPALALAFAIGLLASNAGYARDSCGEFSACPVEGGDYRVHVPADWDGESQIPALVYFHGWKGSADSVMWNEGLTKAADDLGVLLVAPNGQGKSWSFPGSPSHHRDEIAFVAHVLDDVEARYPIAPDRTVAAGFSMGASMAWFTACYLGDRFDGFIPVAGAYWNPIPTDCPSPVPNLIQIHGTSDTVVPMEGRPIGDSSRQSDVMESLTTWRKRAGCAAQPLPAELGDLACERWQSCGGKRLELCTHSGGHEIEPGWIEDAYRALQASH
ncbi:PHB depolymerase family esterase [Amorphus sp. 3PC139-8]|uniref:alpha/beta hydrolase family esterase n=1 Tax=Amorphus sp. 3PC139-8 TaxID=2735676 RepID=UPI00345D02AA